MQQSQQTDEKSAYVPQWSHPIPKRRKTDVNADAQEEDSLQLLEWVLLWFMLACIALSVYQKMSEVVQ